MTIMLPPTIEALCALNALNNYRSVLYGNRYGDMTLDENADRVMSYAKGDPSLHWTIPYVGEHVKAQKSK